MLLILEGFSFLVQNFMHKGNGSVNDTLYISLIWAKLSKISCVT